MRSSSSTAFFQLLLLQPATALIISPPQNLVVLGPGSPDVQAIASKLAANAGYRVSLVARDAERSTKLMYGSSASPAEPPRAVAADGNSDIGSALAKAEACLLVAESGGETGIATTLKFAPKLTRLVLLTSIGGSFGKGGLTYMGEGASILDMEKEVCERCERSGVDVDLVRVGVLKGGGPPFGLDASYYDSLRVGGYPTPSFATAQGYDKETLGVSCAAGDAIEPRNALARSGSKTDVGPQRDECSRIVAAGAMLGCLRQPSLVHVSLSAMRGASPPTEAEWDAMLNGASTAAS